MYNSFSASYDYFVNWQSRLSYEMPFLLRSLSTLQPQSSQPLSVLDAACGTGMHAIALQQAGFRAAGADLSAGMVERARENAAASSLDIPFKTAGFTNLADAFAQNALFPFDALVCLGNSLPHLVSEHDLHAALNDFAACLRKGGMVFLQNRNFDAVMRQRERWMEPQSHVEGDEEWLFLRFYDYLPDGLVDFNILSLHRSDGNPWQQQVMTTRLRPLMHTELLSALTEAGFNDITAYGDMTGKPFDPLTSPNLIVTARKRAS